METKYKALVEEVVKLRKLDRVRRQICEEAEAESRRLRFLLLENTAQLEHIHEHLQKACNEDNLSCAKALSSRCLRVLVDMKKG